MNHLSRLLVIFAVLRTTAATAAPADAQRIEESWQLTFDKWALETRVAATPEARAKVWNSRPGVAPFARQMWDVIGPALNDEGSLEAAAWFLRVAPGVVTRQADGSTSPAFAKEIEAIRKAVETRHLKSPKLISMCMALATIQDPRSLSLLEKIQVANPDAKIQGVAALAAAVILKSLGDNPDLMRKRLTALRKAIIQSSDVVIGSSRRIVGTRFVEDGVEGIVAGGGTTVAKLAEDELYIISHLSKGRIAPDLSGTDSGGRPLKLSDHKGKVIVLLFWNNTMPDGFQVVKITAAMAKKFQNRPFIVIGVNSDTVKELRDLEADGTIPWINFSDPTNKLAEQYRVGVRPLVYVVDGERKIHYAGAPGSFAELTADALLSEMKPPAKE